AASSPLPLAPCHLPMLAEAALCGSWTVFEDRDARSGHTLTLQVAVLRARRRDSKPDPLVFLAGGPGQGARDLAGAADTAFAEVRRYRDLVFVDLRGTGG